MFSKKDLLGVLTIVILIAGIVVICRFPPCPSIPLTIGPTAVLASLRVATPGQDPADLPTPPGNQATAAPSLPELANEAPSSLPASPHESWFTVREVLGGVHIEAPLGATYSATLCDGIGNEVGSKVVLQGGNTTLAINSRQPGIYFVKIGRAGGNVFVRRLVIGPR